MACRCTLLVLTGGEPLLQVTDLLVALLRGMSGWTVAVETNGTRPAPDGLWVTMSPKLTRAATVLKRADEIKVVVPSYKPGEWEGFPATHRFVSPADGIPGSTAYAVRYVNDHPSWRLTTQMHKHAGFP